MSILLELHPELEARLRADAEKRGEPIEALLKGWIEEKVGQAVSGTQRECLPKTGAELLEKMNHILPQPLFLEGPDSPELVRQWRDEIDARAMVKAPSSCYDTPVWR